MTEAGPNGEVCQILALSVNHRVKKNKEDENAFRSGNHVSTDARKATATATSRTNWNEARADASSTPFDRILSVFVPLCWATVPLE